MSSDHEPIADPMPGATRAERRRAERARRRGGIGPISAEPLVPPPALDPADAIAVDLDFKTGQVLVLLPRPIKTIRLAIEDARDLALAVRAGANRLERLRRDVANGRMVVRQRPASEGDDAAAEVAP